MNDPLLIVWSLLALAGFAGSALYSGMETGSYSLNRIRLQVLTHQNNRAATALSRLLSHPTALLTTLLIGNNITNYLGTAAMGVILASLELGDWEVILLNALIVTPVLFVVGETLPKDLFAAHCDILMYRLAPVLTFSRTVFTYTGLVPMVTVFSGMLLKAIGQGPQAPVLHPRRQVGLLVREGVGYGLLSQEQSAIVDRVLQYADRKVGDEMTPWADVERLREQDGADAIWELARQMTHAYAPVLGRSGEVVGILRLNDALIFGKENCPPISELIDPAQTVPHDMPVREALSQIKRRTVGLAVVIGKAGQPVGIVTVKDLVEPITGDLAQW